MKPEIKGTVTLVTHIMVYWKGGGPVTSVTVGAGWLVMDP